MPADEDREKAAHGNEVLNGRARATLGDRFHCGKARQVWYRYLLVLVDTFLGWVEAFPTKGETATVVTKKILEEIVPRYGLPVTMGSDNGPAFCEPDCTRAGPSSGDKMEVTL